MASNKRFTAKLLAATTLLAAGGAGVHALTSGSGAAWWIASKDDSNGAAATRNSAADLDAVASAWADSTAPKSTVANESSVFARSADVTLSRPKLDTAQPVDDRYGNLRRNAMPRSETDSRSSGNPPGEEPETTIAAKDRNSAPTEFIAGDSIPVPQVLASADQASPRPTNEATVARGQNATSAPSESIEPIAVPSGSENLSLGSGVDPAAIRFPVDTATPETERGAATARARQAFNEQPATSGGDRYGAPNSPSHFAESNSPRNPFISTSGQPASNGVQETQASHTNSAMPAPAATPFSAFPATASTYGAANANDSRTQANPPGPTDYRGAPSNGAAAAFGGGGGLSPSNSITPIGGDTIAAGGSAPSGGEGTGRPGERALEGAQNPALVIQKTAPPEIQVNKPAKFVTQIRNVGGQAAAEVVVQDQIPKGTRLLSSSPPAQVVGDKLVWRVGTLSIGEERKIEMQLMPIAEGEVGSVATVSYSAQASAKTRSTMPQLAIRMTSPRQVMVGQEQRVKIFLHNPGTGDATGVMLFENVPENVRHAAGPALEFEIGTLRAGETRELELVLLAEKPGKVANVLSARADGNLQVQHQVEFEVIAPALTVAVVGPERRYLERPATYAVRVENPGTAPARDIQLVTKLPKGMKFVRANNMGEYDANTHAVYWSLAELPEGEHGSVELTAIPTETGPQTLEVEGRAQQGLSDQTKHPILVEGLAAIMFEVRDLEDPIEIGRETGYEIRVVNQGTKAATNVQIAVALPQGMQVISAEGETQHTVQPGGLVFAPLRQLAPKADTVFRVKVLCQRPGDQRVTVEVKTDDMQPIRREESTRVFGDD